MMEFELKKDCEIKDRVLIDLNNTSLTLGEVLGRVESYKNDPEYINCEIFMDGDRFAIVAKGLVLRATRLCGQSVKMSVWFLTEEGEDALKGRSAA